ncbi:MAG: hypothetical protein PHH30_11180, partial [Bacteroidales bacterium]|nr:hypothetical protein [Bacteroidales bacterium]
KNFFTKPGGRLLPKIQRIFVDPRKTTKSAFSDFWVFGTIPPPGQPIYKNFFDYSSTNNLR